MLFYHLDGAVDRHGDPPYPDFGDLKARTQRMKDLVVSLIHEGSPTDAIVVRRSFKSLKEAHDEALAIATDLVNITSYWEHRR